jgi:ketosteroid isomerase-like protein
MRSEAESGNLAVVRKLLDAFGAGDMDRLLSFIDENAIWLMPGPPKVPFAGVRTGRDQIRQFYRILMETCEFEHWELRKLISDGDDVIAIGFERVKAKLTGKKFEHHLAILYTLRDGKVVAAQFFEDTAAEEAAFS